MKCLVSHRNEKGLSLVELAIVVGIMVMIIAALYTMLIGGYDQWNYSDKRIEEYQNARSGMTRMVKELRYTIQIVNTVPYPTNSYSISAYGLAVTNKTLSTSNNTDYTAGDGPWISAPGIIVRVNNVITTSNFTVDYTNGIITFSPALAGGSVVKADYSRNAYVRYYLSGTDLRRAVNGTDVETVAKYIVNQTLSTPIFTLEAASMVKIYLMIDRDTTQMPKEYILESRVRLRE